MLSATEYIASIGNLGTYISEGKLTVNSGTTSGENAVVQPIGLNGRNFPGPAG
jgi:hypothetical protein